MPRIDRSARRRAARDALGMSLDFRRKLGIDLHSRVPIDIYAACDSSGIRVRFVDISMEGVYLRSKYPTIMLSSLRPLSRRTFTCAHEIGHHLFGHGSTIDELVTEGSTSPGELRELTAQLFASYVLLPTLGTLRAFNIRGWDAQRPSPSDLFVVASQFGVSYQSLITHMTWNLELLTPPQAKALGAIRLAKVREQVIGFPSGNPLIVVDSHWELPAVDVEVGHDILFPANCVLDVDGVALESVTDVRAGRLVHADHPGIAYAHWQERETPLPIRIARKQFVGLSRYRYIDRPGEDEESDVE